MSMKNFGAQQSQTAPRFLSPAPGGKGGGPRKTTRPAFFLRKFAKKTGKY